ncbi:MAG: ribose 5-phosphate isomerase B [Nitrospinota bacterium]|nr:ribose 5-phosphate isomerase B [Nitrospinota bacterium]
MRPIAIGSDHAGFILKEFIKKYLLERDILFADYGTFSEESCDYPDFAALVSGAVTNGESDKGILFCGSSSGMVIVANKFKGVRAVACHDPFVAEMSRKHNDSNVLALGGRIIELEKATEIVQTWLDTEFEGGRHKRRLDKLRDIEEGFG